jgi:hypothetical protein
MSVQGAVERLAVALGKAGTGEIADPGWSDRQSQLIEGSQEVDAYREPAQIYRVSRWSMTVLACCSSPRSITR